jgi:hypothetical protein
MEVSNIKRGGGDLTMIKAESSTCVSGCVLIGKLGGYFSVLGGNGKVIMIKTDMIKVFHIYEKDIDL